MGTTHGSHDPDRQVVDIERFLFSLIFRIWQDLVQSLGGRRPTFDAMVWMAVLFQGIVQL